MALSRYVVPLVLACALLPACGFAGESQKVVVKGKRDPSTIVIKGVRDPSDWLRVESPHFVVLSDDEPDQAADLADNLERLDYMLRLYLKPFMDTEAPDPKFTVVFQRRLNWPAEIGVHHPFAVARLKSCGAGAQAFTFDGGRMWKLDNATALHNERDFTLMWNLYFYAEAFLYRHTRVRGPRWFLTGVAAYFGGVRFTDTQMVVGRAAGTSYDLLQAIDDGRAKSLSYDDVLHIGAPSGPGADIVGTPAYYDAWEYLGRAYNLMHFMLSSEENRNKMASYLEQVNGGADPAAAFAGVFGLSGRALDVAMWRYRRSDMKIIQVEVPGLPTPHLDFTRLSRLEGQFVLDNAVLKTCPAPEDGKKLLARLKVNAAQASAVDFAQVTLSRAEVDWGNPRDAIGYLSQAVQRDPYNPETRYLLGLAYLHLAENGGGDQVAMLAAARDSLTEAAILAPEAPEVSYALFRTGILGADPTDKDVKRAVDAWAHGHEVAPFARAGALAYAWLGDAAGAYRVFTTLARNTQELENARWAEAWLARLEKGVPRDELLAAMRKEKPASAGLQGWGISYR
jgi:hypothetical protein